MKINWCVSFKFGFNNAEKLEFEPGLNTVVAVGEQEWSKIEAALYNTKINLSNKNCENRILNWSIAVISLNSLDLWIFMCALLHHGFIAFLIVQHYLHHNLILKSYEIKKKKVWSLTTIIFLKLPVPTLSSSPLLSTRRENELTANRP